jgi:hypothetical protein
VKSRIRGPAAVTKTTATTSRKTVLKTPASQAERSARSGLFAPRFWPTRVAAALARPHEGRMAKMTRRMAMV